MPQYEHPIPSREALIHYLRLQPKPLRHKDIAKGMGISSAYEIDGILRRLNAMVRDGQLLQDRGGAYSPLQYNVQMAIEEAIATHELPTDWDAAIAPTLPEAGQVLDSEEIKKRQDLRQLPLVTIDGEDAKDFDDAVFCEPQGQDWHIIVAIADVSYYVRPNTPLDREALLRGTSVYFPGHVVPMLPEVLSNGLCSLVPHEDRFCLAVDMVVTAQGELKQSQFYPAVMCSHARLTYGQVQAFLDQESELADQAVKQNVMHLHQAFQALLKDRHARGALDFDTPEVVVHLDNMGQPDTLSVRHRQTSHRIIEECMLLANKATAEFLEAHNTRTLFRVHTPPDEDRVESLRQYLSFAGITLHTRGGITAKAMNDACIQAKDRPDIDVIELMVLRSMNQAIYTPDNDGHFGLAYDAYVQFTSPIRRYPDLVAHRVIRSVLDSQDPAGMQYGDRALDDLGELTSMTERRAEEASRLVVQKLKCAFMLDKIGEEYEGVVASAVSFGLFVTLPEFLIDGLVPMRYLSDDFYHFDEVRHQLRGEVSGRCFKQGDVVRVKVVRVAIEDGQIDFVLADQADSVRLTRGGRRGRGAKQLKQGKAAKAKQDIPKQKRRKVKKMRLKRGKKR